MEQREILVKSTVDGSMQPNLFYKSQSFEKRPLIVGLHTWSHNRFNQIGVMLPFAEKNDFNLLLPEFRGSNLIDNPICTEACGSALAQQDIQDAIDYVIKNENVDSENVFLIGASGGGHMALLMAAKCPEYFKTVASFVPITDLTLWEKQNPSYRPHVLACTSSSTTEMLKRSPIIYIDELSKANVKIFHGKYDPVVPVSHSISLFNAMMAKYPKSRVFLDIFDGGHEMDMNTAMNWVLSQYKEKKSEQVTG